MAVRMRPGIDAVDAHVRLALEFLANSILRTVSEPDLGDRIGAPERPRVCTTPLLTKTTEASRGLGAGLAAAPG